MYKGKREMNYFEENRADHELYFYDPFYMDRNYSQSMNSGTNSVYRRCAYGQDVNYHLFNYGEKFFDAYKDDRKVMYFDF